MSSLVEILADDLEALFGEFSFAEDAVFTPEDGEDATIRVIFDEAYQEVDPKSKAPIGGTAPAAFVQASALPELGEEDRLTIRGQAYRIVLEKPDGQGSVLLRLHEVSA